MRKILLTASFAAFSSFLYADEPSALKQQQAVPTQPARPIPAIPIQPAQPARPAAQPAQKKEATLKVGDAAPKLTVDKWMQGAEVNSFAPEKVYVVEFWATWCGPCIVMMPHMAEMQSEYRDKGVTFIGFSAKDPNNSEEKVAEFVHKRGPKLGYTFAYGDNRDTYGAWMTAASQNGIPCSFVVDKAGKIAYIGHPMMLDYVLPKVVAGQWTEEDVKAVDGIKEEISTIFKANGDKDPEVGLKAMAELTKKYSWAANIPYFTVPKITKLVQAKKTEEARLMALNELAKAMKYEDTAKLNTLASALRMPGAKENKQLVEVSVQAAEANLKLAGESDFNALSSVTESHFAAGDSTKAGAYAAKMIAAIKTPFQITMLLRSSAVKDNKGLLSEVLKVAETQLKDANESGNYQQIMNVAETHSALGDKAKATEFIVKAIPAAKAPNQLSMLLHSPDVKGNREIMADLLKAAEEQLKKLGDNNYMALMNVADAHFALGDKAKAKEYGEKAVAAARIPAVKTMLENRVKKFDE